MQSQQLKERNMHLLFFGTYPLKQRRLSNTQPDKQTYDDQQCAQIKRYTPSPDRKLGSRDRRHDAHSHRREEEAKRSAYLRPACPESSVARMPLLQRQQNSPTPLATNSQPLTEAQNGNQQRSRKANGVVTWHEADQKGCNPHQQERKDESRFPPHAITKMPEKDAAK